MSLRIFGHGTVDLTQHYPDGTPLVKLEPLDRLAWSPWLLRPESWGEFWTAMALADAVRDRVGPEDWKAELMLPLVPGSRQDRVMGAAGDQLQTLRTVCDCDRSWWAAWRR
jgi:hypothetical protein